MIVGIDGDIIAYRCAASCEKQGVVVEDLGVAQMRAHELMTRIIKLHSPEEDFLVCLSGENNFRKKLNPAYKANRKNQTPPRWLKEMQEWLKTSWGAEYETGLEADDLLGIHQTRHGDNFITCTLDKDLRQVPGWHYSWEIQGTSSLGKLWVRPEEKIFVSPLEGLFNFYWQLIMGDATDNIFGFDGKARAKIPKFLEEWNIEMQSYDTEKDLFDFVREKYNDDNRLLMNGACLWVLRKVGDDWQDHARNLMGENGPREDSTPLSPQPSGLEPEDGLPNTSV